MAEEDDNGQEKSEDPTPKKLEKAREEGQIPRSKELGTTMILMGGAGALLVFGGSLGQTLEGVMAFNFNVPRAAAFDTQLMLRHLAVSAMQALQAIAPIFGALALAAIIGPLALGGWLISVKALAPNFERLDPIAGLKRMFDLNALVELIKSLAKFAVVASVAVLTLIHFKARLLGLSQAALEPAVATMLSTVGWCALAVSSGMLILSAIDVPYQLYDHNKKMKMTHQELKNEMKDVEGKPEVKGRVRQLQREAAQRRMMEAVPEADVVITNPQHFSVALRYDVEGSGAPVVVAKGTDFIALKIREVANAHQVMILASPPLARAIYFTTELDDEIPGKLYLAVAQVLAYVFQLKAYREGAGRKPRPLGQIDIPEDVYYDHRGHRARPGSTR